MFIKSINLFTIFAIFLTVSFLVQAMENEDTSDSHVTSLSFKGIEIPSLAEQVGIKFLSYISPQTKRSWEDLREFTKQTLSNFQSENKKGILYIHSLEDIMGVPQCFATKWNEVYSDDQRILESDDKNFHNVFSFQEFVDHYIEFVMAQRVLISGSVIALNNPPFTLKATFSPVNFILDVPEQCVVMTSRKDAQTPVRYAPLRESYSSWSLSAYVKENAKNRITLDSLVRFPELQTIDEKKFWNQMNEVAIASCAQQEEILFRPKIVGVLINESAPLPVFDYGNGERNREWISAAENFANQNRLPLLKIDEKTTHYFDENEAGKIAEEWFKGKSSSVSAYVWQREDIEYEEEKNLKTNLKRIIMDELKKFSKEEHTPDNYKKIGSIIIQENPQFSLVFQEVIDGGTASLNRERSFLLADQLLKTYGLNREEKH